MASRWEEALVAQLGMVGLRDYVREHVFAQPRKWRFDLAWPAHKLAVEVEGGVWAGGRHSRGSGFHGDVEKYNTAALLGWRVIRVTDRHIKSGEALTWIERGLGRTKES